MQLERYQIVRELGSGATAQVSLALDTNDRKLVALKRLHHIYALSGGARLRREFRALSSLNHPNIVRVYDHGEAGGTPFLALEYVEGVTLAEWLSAPHALPEITALFAEVADALEAVHTAGLIHRDLKPENIMVTKSGSAKLMDFGLTKLMAQQSLALTKIGAMVGTVLYMSPEQCRGLEIDARADLYALGAVLYNAVTSEPPFLGSSLTAVVLQHLSAPIPSPRAARVDLPKPLEKLIVQLLAKEPADRPRSAAEVARRLRAVFDATPLEEALPVPPSTVRLLRAPLIGREAERVQLEAALRVPQPGFVALIGEAGSGKSRLLEALSGRTITVAAQLEDTEPFALIAALLRALELDAPLVFSNVSEAQRTILRALEDGVLEGGVNDAVVTAQRFEAFRQLLEVAATTTTIALEDVQYADAGTLAMLAHGFREAQHTRVVVTYRPEELRGGKPRLLPAARDTVTLEGLEKREMQVLLEARLGGATQVGLRDALLERANGNPWALDELLREMIARSAILEQSGVFEWDRQHASRGAVNGAGLLGSAGQRLKHLAPGARMFAETAAVLGREFHFEDARSLLGWDDDAALGALEVLLTGKVLLERPSGDEFAFAHPEYVRFLRGGLEPERAGKLHAAAFERLQTRADDFALAEHALQAQRPQDAFRLALRAGETALRKLHYFQAEQAFQMALEAARAVEIPAALEAEAKLGLAEALSAAGRPEDASALWETLAGGTGVVATRAKLRLAEWRSTRGETAEALALLSGLNSDEAALGRAKIYYGAAQPMNARREALRVNRSSRAYAESIFVLGCALLDLGQYRRCLVLAGAVQRLAPRESQPLLWLQALNLKASALIGLQQWPRALELYSTVADEAERIGNVVMRLHGLNNTAMVFVIEDRVPEALTRYERARQLAHRQEDKARETIAAMNNVLCLAMLGRLEGAHGLAAEYAEDATARLWMARLERLLGRDASVALPSLQELAPWHHGLHAVASAEALLEAGEYERVLKLCEVTHDDYQWFWALFAFHARMASNLQTPDVVKSLEPSQKDPGLDRGLAGVYAEALEAGLRGEKNQLEGLTSSLIGVTARFVLRSDDGWARNAS